MNLKYHSLAMFRFGCIALMLAAAVSMQAQQDIFMRIGGQAAAMGSQQTTPTLAGESTDPQYPNWIPVLSMSHGVSSSVSVIGGGGGGKPNHQDVHYVKLLDKTTPSVALLVNATNVTASVTQPIDYVTIDFRKAGTNVFYRLELQGVYFTSDQVGGVSGGDLPTEQVSFVYSKIRWSYRSYDALGKATTTTKGWDVVAGKEY